MSLIFKHPLTGGELRQAGAREIPKIIRDHNIDVIILAAEEFQPHQLPKSNRQFQKARRIYVPMDDNSKLKGKKLKDTIDYAKYASNVAIESLLEGKNVLSTCWAGWNRSGLISGFTIKQITRKDPKKIVRGIRRKRSIFALSNPLFVKLIKAY